MQLEKDKHDEGEVKEGRDEREKKGGLWKDVGKREEDEE